MIHLIQELFGQTLSSGKSIAPGGDGQYPAFGSNGAIGRSDKSLFDAGIVIGRVGAYCGSIAISTSPFWASDNTIVALPKEGVDLRFAYFLLSNARLNRHAGGSAQPLLTQSRLKPLRFAVPSLTTQRRVASILGAYDDLIEVNRQRIALLEEITRRLFEEWFVRFRFPGHENHLVNWLDVSIATDGGNVALPGNIRSILSKHGIKHVS
jgi:type I restriction enzyme, S subunit